MPVAKVGDINLYYEMPGKGEPLILIMGYSLRQVWKGEYNLFQMPHGWNRFPAPEPGSLLATATQWTAS